jgi:membrane glycosyltransferase
MELHPPAQLKRAAHRSSAAERYLERLALRPDRRRELLRRVAAAGGADERTVMGELHRMLAGEVAPRDNAAYASVGARLRIAYGTVEGGPPLAEDAHGRCRMATTRALSRKSMAPREWRGGAGAPVAASDWHRAGTLRRSLLLALTAAQTSVAAWCMSSVLPYHGAYALELAVLVLFVVLFGWVSAGFWTAMMGFFVQLLGDERFAISAGAGLAGDGAPIDRRARTAIVMPICNEDVQRVFAGIRATYESVSRTGEMKHFDFFILSDSSDPDLRVAETHAWLGLCREVKGFGNIFYRWRQHRIKRKSGNVGDFCRRWGDQYRYMVVMDADSVMSGACLARLVRLMEANPGAGIIQTAPRAAGRETLFARVQQFATRLYGPLFTAGLHYWQLGESHYWGHNAIIRLAPFMRHCALGRLPGGGSLSGEILSHDFVEAALMRRAGWGVWIAYDLPGSYEEMPPNLVDELKRDRRWCHGNLINSRLMFGEGLHPAHRAVFMTGVMAYLSAPLWFLFLVLSTVLLAVHTLVPPTYFIAPNQLFPLWPEWHQEWAMALSLGTGALLFLPKILSGALACAQGAREYGGPLRLCASLAGEVLFSALLAPVRMMFHTQFVLTSLLGWQVHWKSPPREDAQTGWVEALRRHGAQTLLGLAWAGAVYWLNPSYLWWLLPVVGALVLSIPVSVYSSRVSIGRRMRRAGYFAIPEETNPPQELVRVRQLCALPARMPALAEAVVDPVVNALACATSVARPRQPEAVRAQRAQLIDKALRAGPHGLTGREAATLLGDPLALSRLHFAAWTAADAHPDWCTARVASDDRSNVIALRGRAARRAHGQPGARRADRQERLSLDGPPGRGPRPPAGPPL